jgi:hypothetical protein
MQLVDGYLAANVDELFGVRLSYICSTWAEHDPGDNNYS